MWANDNYGKFWVGLRIYEKLSRDYILQIEALIWMQFILNTHILVLGIYFGKQVMQNCVAFASRSSLATLLARYSSICFFSVF